MHKSQSLFNLTTALHVLGITITHLQEHKTTVTTASGNRYTVIDRVKILLLTHCGWVTLICVFNTVKLGYICKFSLVPLHKGECFQRYHTLKHY